MVLSNAERQARFRQRKSELAQAQINRYRARIDAALEWIAKIDAGQRHYTATGLEPLRDYTDELRAEKVAEVEMFENLIKVWAKDLTT